MARRFASFLPSLLACALQIAWAAQVGADSSHSKMEAAGKVDSDSAASISALTGAMAEGYLRVRLMETGGLDRGPMYKLGRVIVLAQPGFPADAIGLAVHSGEPASARNVQAIVDQTKAWLLNHGFPFARISVDFAATENETRVDMVLSIEPGDGYKYGGFKATGSRMLPEVLEKLSLLQYGETYSVTRVRASLDKLGRTGYFEAILPGALFRDSTKNLLYPSLALKDLKGNRLSGILGYDSEKKDGGGLNGYMDLHLIDLRGTARDLDFTFESKQTAFGKPDKEAHLTYTEPWILSTPVGAKVDLQVSLEDSLYDESNAGLELFQDMDFHSRYFITFTRQSNHDYIGNTRSEGDIAGLGFQYDDRDQVPATLRGVRLSTRVNGLHRDLGDSAYFLVQSLATLELWRNLGRWVAYAQFSGAGDWPLRPHADRGELFSIGGANTIRGFREKEFLTDFYAYANLEIQFLLARKSRASIFVVPSLVNKLGGDIDWRRVMGYGIGLESGASDWTFGISYALNPDRAFGDGFIHMRVTNNF